MIKGVFVCETPGGFQVILITPGVIIVHGNGTERTAVDAFGTAVAASCVDPGNIVVY